MSQSKPFHDQDLSGAGAGAGEQSRRGFLELVLGWLAALFGFGASAAAAVRFLVPNVLFEPSQVFRAGKPADYADPSVTFLEDERVFVVRKGNAFRCLSAVCTHLGCTVNRAPHGYHCPCHGSLFDNQGDVKGGPAPRPLPWFLVTLTKDNQLLVDKSRQVNADKYLVV
jgi:cytochrome b6-f complex iron-sulfur subunit